MKKKISMWFWNTLWSIDTFNHKHFEDSPILWTIFGGWFCKWINLNDPKLKEIRDCDYDNEPDWDQLCEDYKNTVVNYNKED